MKRQIYFAGMLSAAMLLAACDGDDGLDGSDGVDGEDGFNSLVALREIPEGDAVCLGGGLAFDSGLDTNRNDVLDPEEVTNTEFIECEATPTVRVLHASPNAPAVNILVNGEEALSGVDYAQGSGFLPVVEENNIQVEAIIPGGNAVVIDADVALDYSTEATIIAVDNVPAIAPLAIVNSSDSAITTGNFRAQVVHAAPAAPAVDVYVTTFDADLAASTPINGAGNPLAFQDFTEQLETPAGDYQIRITAGGDPSAVVYDSGEISLAEGADLMIVAVENTGPGATPVQLIVLDGTAASQLNDVDTPASVIAAHLSPDAPAVDLLADVNDTTEDEAIPLVRNVAFTEFCELDSVPAPGDYTISVVANSDNSIVALQFPLAVEQGTEAIAAVSGFLSSGDPAITALPLVDGSTRSVVTETKLRITHGSPSTGPVDLYLVATGTDISGVEPTFADVPFGADTTQLSVANAVYDAIVTPAGTKTAAISLTGLDFSAGGAVIDVIARDPATDGSEGALPLPVVIDHAAVPVCPAP